MTLTISKVATFYKRNIKKNMNEFFVRDHPLVTSIKMINFLLPPGPQTSKLRLHLSPFHHCGHSTLEFQSNYIPPLPAYTPTRANTRTF